MSFSGDFQCVINTTSTFSSNSSTLSRLSPLTETIPIPLIPVCNRPLVYYQLDLVVKSNFSGVVLNLIVSIFDGGENNSSSTQRWFFFNFLVMIKVEEYIKENKLSGSFEVEYVVLIERSRGVCMVMWRYCASWESVEVEYVVLVERREEMVKRELGKR